MPVLKYNVVRVSTELQHLLTEPRFDDDMTTPPLQAADLYAWWARKWAIEELQGVDLPRLLEPINSTSSHRGLGVF